MNSNIFSDFEIKVSIICITYNHVEYIRRAIQSFIEQKTDFKFEIIIHDDCSTDGTIDIIKEYANLYPDIIHPIYEIENQYSQGRKVIQECTIPSAKGKYFALCEGDDYWIDNMKLQRQFDFMEAHPEYTLCVHNAIRVNDQDEFIRDWIVSSVDSDVSFDEVILGGGGFLPTNSIFAPMRMINHIPSYLKEKDIDYLWQIYLSSSNKVYCFKDQMSAYRQMSKQSWTYSMKKNKVQYAEHIRHINELLVRADQETGFTNHASFQCKIIQNKDIIYL